MKLIYLIIGLFMSITVNAAQIEVSEASPALTEGRYSYDFGTVWVHQSTTRGFNLKNTGTTPLTYKDAVIYGADYSARHSCNKTVMPNESCSFEVTYWPVFEGMSSGRFVLSFIEDQIVMDLWGRARR